MESNFYKNVPTILIIGGGPSGSAAAIFCAKYRFQVILIESAKFPREKPGETLHPGIDVVFKQLGVYDDIQNANFIRFNGVYRKWSGDRPPRMTLLGTDCNGPWLGYQASRTDLDEILLSRARNMGVLVMQPCIVKDIIMESQRVIGVKTSCGENILADFVIDAGGGRHTLAKRIDLTIQKHSPPLYVQYGYARGKCHVRDRAPLIEATSDGWIWTAKVKNGLYHWTRLSFNNSYIPYNWLPDEFSGLTPIHEIHGADVTWRRVMRPAGPGYFIIGDAATVVDPASSHGILKALMSGIKAAHTIFRIFRHNFPGTLASLQYNRWISQWFFHDVNKLKQFYMEHPVPPAWIGQ